MRRRRRRRRRRRITKSYLDLLLRSEFYLSQPFLERVNLIEE